MRQARHTVLAAYFLVFILLCDQLSKWLVLSTIMREGHALRITSFMNIVLTWNKGVTFGLLRDVAHEYMPWVLIGTAVLILLLLGRWLLRTSSMLVAVSLGAIMGGAIGNLIDRLRYGAVIDFLDFYYLNHHWYTFNIADAAIVTGVSLLILESLVRGR